ncbi:hypothetical protein D9M73_236970 [compost metagenome]
METKHSSEKFDRNKFFELVQPGDYVKEDGKTRRVDKKFFEFLPGGTVFGIRIEFEDTPAGR